MFKRKILKSKASQKDVKMTLPWATHSILLPYIQVDSKLGAGAYGTVYKITYKGVIACKKEGKYPNLKGNFAKEAQCLMQLDGAGGASKLLAIASDCPLFIMSYVGGFTLHSIQHKLDTSSLISVYQLLTQKLREVHQAGLVHCDLKESNILVELEQNFSVQDISIIDFGHGRAIGDTLQIKNTKLTWYAPEIFTKQPVSPATDLYSLGFMMKKLFTDKLEDSPPSLQILVDELMQ